jgi:acyl-CoA thioester hydrolase
VSGRDGYPHTLAIPTRWMDNDVYGHVNNVQYYAYFDTVINQYLIAEGGLDIHAGAVIGLCAESHCAFRAALAFPETVDAGLRVAKLGRTSVRYEIGLFRGDDAEPAAEGWFVHVFVDRAQRRPAEIPGPLRAALERLVVADGG